MTRLEKLIQRICSKPPDARFHDVQQLLVGFGWTKARQKGSHVSFDKAGEQPITVPIRDGKVGRVYLRDICSRLDLDLDS